MAMKTPVIIHYKDNGKDDGFDLKMTLRSFNRFMPNIGEVVVVGDRHEWMSDAVTVIPFRHPYASDKDSNIMMACLKGASYLAIASCSLPTRRSSTTKRRASSSWKPSRAASNRTRGGSAHTNRSSTA
jgi:hypothetical protein